MSSRQLGGYPSFSYGGLGYEEYPPAAGGQQEEAPGSPLSLPSDGFAMDYIPHDHPIASSFEHREEALTWPGDGMGGPGSSPEPSTFSSSSSSFSSASFLAQHGAAPFHPPYPGHQQDGYEEEQVITEESVMPPFHSLHEAAPSESFGPDEPVRLFHVPHEAESDSQPDRDDEYVEPKPDMPPPKMPARRKPPSVSIHPAIYDNEDPDRPYTCPLAGCRQRYRFASPPHTVSLPSYVCPYSELITLSRKADLKVHAQSKHSDIPSLAELITPSRRSKTNKASCPSSPSLPLLQSPPPPHPSLFFSFFTSSSS